MRDLLLTAIKAALLGGDEILDVYHNADDVEIQSKDDQSPLTIADKRAHKAIQALLDETSIPVLSEEGKHTDFEERSHWNRLWIVDPLDGTKEFIKRNGEFTVNIALIENGSPVLGVIYVPVEGTLYYGIEGQGAMRISDVKDLQLDRDDVYNRGEKLPCEFPNVYRVVGSRSHMSPETEAFIDELKKTHPDIEIVSKGSSLKICMVAEGEAAVYPRHAPTMEWDTAAGHAIVRAMGGKMVIAGTNQELQYNKSNLLNPHFEVYPKA